MLARESFCLHKVAVEKGRGTFTVPLRVILARSRRGWILVDAKGVI